MGWPEATGFGLIQVPDSESGSWELTLRLPALKAWACLRPELRQRGSGLTLSGASFPRLKRRGLEPPNGSTKVGGWEIEIFGLLAFFFPIKELLNPL
jgi:hypothetical protein